ncbi:MAG: YgiT-type zinc finger protein [Eubacteriales bacterium]|nr:YgiT-type zinc finger protein [Eubacteriales bacterium]
MCSECFNDKKTSKTLFSVELDGYIIVVKNVPCLECYMCGEIYFSDEVSNRLSRIVNTAKKQKQDVVLVDYIEAVKQIE